MNIVSSNVSSGYLVVDLDGTPVNSDMLVENLFLFLRIYPLRVFPLFTWLFGGKAYFKRRLADAVLFGVDNLPYNKPLLKLLQQQREAGFKPVLATASDIRIARAVADHLGIFDEVMGTETQNLSSHRKQAALIGRFGENGYLRDVGQFIVLLTTVLMFLSPIFYPASALPEAYRPLLYMNPLTPVIEQTRDVLFWGKAPDFAMLGFARFQKTRKGFTDVL